MALPQHLSRLGDSIQLFNSDRLTAHGPAGKGSEATIRVQEDLPWIQILPPPHSLQVKSTENGGIGDSVKLIGRNNACCFRSCARSNSAGRGQPPTVRADRLDAILFRHAERLPLEPWTTKEDNMQELRQAGLDDHAILPLTMLCSYLSFENRVAAGLGVAREG